MADRVRPRRRRPAAGRARRRADARARARARRCSGSRAASRGASAAPGGSPSRSSRRRRSPISRRASTSRRRRLTCCSSSRCCARAGSSSHRATRRRSCRSLQVGAGARRRACRSRRSTLYDNDAYSERIDEALLIADRRARRPRALAAGSGRSPSRAGTSPDERRARRGARPAARRTTASRTSRCAATRATSSRRAATRSSPIASSPAPRSSPATRSATPASGTSWSPSSVASRTPRAGGSRSRARRTTRSPTTRRSASSRSISATRPCVKPAEFSLDGRRDPQGAPVGVAAREERLPRCACSRPRTTTTPSCATSSAPSREEWRGSWPERGFTMAMDALFAYPDTRARGRRSAPDGSRRRLPPARAVARERRLLARVDAPPPRHAERADGVPDHRDDRLGAGARRDARSRSTSRSSPTSCAPTGRRADARAALVLLKVDRLFQLERLHSFNRKFFPHWRRRYFCFERWTDLPLAGLAYLHAESLLTPPGPWVEDAGPGRAVRRIALGLVLAARGGSCSSRRSWRRAERLDGRHRLAAVRLRRRAPRRRRRRQRASPRRTSASSSASQVRSTAPSTPRRSTCTT